MGGGPEDHGAQRPESGPIGQDSSRSPGSVEQAGENFRGITIQPQICHRESKSNPDSQVPPRNVIELWLGLDRFGLGLRDRLKLCIHLTPPSESAENRPFTITAMEEAPSCNNPRSLTATYEVCCGLQGLLWMIFQKMNKSQDRQPKCRGAFAKLKTALKHFSKCCELVKRGEERISLAKAANTLVVSAYIFSENALRLPAID